MCKVFLVTLQEPVQVCKETSNSNVFGTTLVTECSVHLSTRAAFAIALTKMLSMPHGLPIIFYASKAASKMVAKIYVHRFSNISEKWKINVACPGRDNKRLDEFQGGGK